MISFYYLQAQFNSWKPEDDQKLLQCVKDLGTKDWVGIANRFSDKTRTQCRNRFHTIYKCFLKDQENFSLDKIKASRLLQKKRQTVLFDNLNKKLSAFLKEQSEARAAEEASGFKKPSLMGFHTTPDGVLNYQSSCILRPFS